MPRFCRLGKGSSRSRDAARRTLCRRSFELISAWVIVLGFAPAAVLAADKSLSGCPVVTTAPSAQSTPVLGTTVSKRATACFLSVADTKRDRLKGGTILVDVRAPADFELYRIPGSLNIPLHLLKTKAFLKQANVVLINEGRSSQELERACNDLQTAGFRRVNVLAGGLNGWRLDGGELIGDVAAQRALDRMDPDEMLAERAYTDWLVLDFTNGKRKDVYRWLPANVVRVKGAPDAIRQGLAQKRKTITAIRVVAVADTDADYARIEPAIKKAGVKGVLYLAGGLKAYGEFVHKQIAMWNQKDQPVKLPSCRG